MIPAQAVAKLKHLKRAPELDSWVVDVQAKPGGDVVAGATIARVVVVTSVDPALRGLVAEQRRVETLDDPPTIRLLRSFGPVAPGPASAGGE